MRLLALIATSGCIAEAWVDSAPGPTPAPVVPTTPAPQPPVEPDLDPVVHVDHLPDYLEQDWFDETEVHTIELVVGREGQEALMADGRSWVRGHARVDGVLIEDVGVRLKGGSSYRNLPNKASFKIDLNRHVPGRRHLGQEMLILNSSIYDCSWAKEAIGYRIMAAAGVPASRHAYAAVTLDGVYMGLYNAIEHVDDAFLDRHFAAPHGNLYRDGRASSAWGAAEADFVDDGYDLFDLREGVDIGWADTAAVTVASARAAGGEGYASALAPLVDWDAHHRLWFAEQWIGQTDGYTLNLHNTYTYFDAGGGGQVRMMPWDLDLAFLDPEAEFDEPVAELAARCLDDPACVADLRTTALAVLDALDAADLPAQLERLYELSEPWADADPLSTCAFPVAVHRTNLSDWVGARSRTLRARLE